MNAEIHLELMIYFGLGILWLSYQLLFLTSDEERKETVHTFTGIAWHWRIMATVMILFFWWAFFLNAGVSVFAKKQRGINQDTPSQ